jgi:hypothetical protein
MPDGDNVHVNLTYRYQKVYKQLCEDSTTTQHLPTRRCAR